jgi:hypothetical protein
LILTLTRIGSSGLQRLNDPKGSFMQVSIRILVMIWLFLFLMWWTDVDARPLGIHIKVIRCRTLEGGYELILALGAWITGNPHTTLPLINQSCCTGEHVEIKWSGMTATWIWDPLILGLAGLSNCFWVGGLGQSNRHLSVGRRVAVDGGSGGPPEKFDKLEARKHDFLTSGSHTGTCKKFFFFF